VTHRADQDALSPLADQFFAKATISWKSSSDSCATAAPKSLVEWSDIASYPSNYMLVESVRRSAHHLRNFFAFGRTIAGSEPLAYGLFGVGPGAANLLRTFTRDNPLRQINAVIIAQQAEGCASPA